MFQPDEDGRKKVPEIGEQPGLMEHDFERERAKIEERELIDGLLINPEFWDRYRKGEFDLEPDKPETVN